MRPLPPGGSSRLLRGRVGSGRCPLLPLRSRGRPDPQGPGSAGGLDPQSAADLTEERRRPHGTPDRTAPPTAWRPRGAKELGGRWLLSEGTGEEILLRRGPVQGEERLVVLGGAAAVTADVAGQKIEDRRGFREMAGLAQIGLHHVGDPLRGVVEGRRQGRGPR